MTTAARAARKHGHARKGRVSAEYAIWSTMKARCLCSTNTDFPDYGGRGITVCDRWRDSFTNFLADMGPRPSPRHLLDRKDNDGPYSPDNCRWATPVESGRNSRKNRLLTFAGETLCLSAWAERIGMEQDTLQRRLARGWSLVDALSIKPGPFARHRTLPPENRSKLGRPKAVAQ